MCINIVGNLVKNYGANWEEEVPALLRTDMESLRAADEGDLNPLNLQQRVIQSGLDSIADEDAENICTMFKAMAVFQEVCTSLRQRS